MSSKSFIFFKLLSLTLCQAWIFVIGSLFLVSFLSPEGIRYQHITADVSHSIHVLEVNPRQFLIVPARALDKCVGREDVLSLSRRKGAVAAVNGGFFSIGGNHDGCPCGILKISGEWYGLPAKPRGAIGWRNATVLFDRVLTHLDGIDFHVVPQTGTTIKEQWERVDHVVGGAPLLIQNGKKIRDFSPEKIVEGFLNQRHARTAVGVLANGNWIFVVVGGKLDPGMTIHELSDFMESLGCIDALNLDGGESSTFVYQNRILNQPVGELRAVSDAILILPK